MASFGEYIVVYDLLPELADRLDKALSRIVRKAALDIAADAMANAPVGPTGFLKNSIYVEAHTPSAKYAYGRQEAPEGAELLPEVVVPDSPTEAIVAVGANYGVYVEFGTINMGARPFLTPAAEYVRPKFMQALALLETKMAVPLAGGVDDVGTEES